MSCDIWPKFYHVQPTIARDVLLCDLTWPVYDIPWRMTISRPSAPLDGSSYSNSRAEAAKVVGSKKSRSTRIHPRTQKPPHLTDQKLLRNREQEVKQSILQQILEPDAADRLGRIRLVKASRADDVENRLIMLARSGQLRQKVNEEQLKQILEAVSEQQQEAEKITVTRRKGGWDDDDLDDLLNEG